MPAAPPPTLPGWRQALALGGLLCAAELLLTRFSGEQHVAPITAAVSIGAWLLLAGGPALILDRLPLPPKVRALLHRLAGWGLCSIVGLGIIGPQVNEQAGRLGVAIGAAVLMVTLALASRLSRRHPSVYPRPAAVLLVLVLCAVGSWLAGPGTLPPPSALAPLVLSWAGVGALASVRRGAVFAATFGLLMATIPGFTTTVAWSERAPGSGPDLIVVSVDALRFDGARTMTAYRRIAAEGVEFTAAQAPAPWTLPSIASLQTGIPPTVHGAGSQGSGAFSGVRPDAPSLAAALAARGYDTAGVIAPNPFAGASFGLDRGFDHFNEPGSRLHSLPRGSANRAACPLLVRLVERAQKSILCHAVDGEAITDYALSVVAQRRDRPLYLWVHLLDAHLPYTHTVDSSVSAATRRAIGSDDRNELARLQGSPGLERELRAANADELRFVDMQVQRLLDGLGAPPANGRVVVLTSDHGEEFFEHGGFEHGHALFQEVLHIPLVVSGLERRGVVDTPVTLMDVSVTLLAAAGGHDAQMVGVDLVGPLDPQRMIHSGNMLRIAPEKMFASRRGTWKAIWTQDAPPALYELSSDPSESHNVAADHPEVFEAFTSEQPRASLEPLAPVHVEGQQKALLEALGYLAPTE